MSVPFPISFSRLQMARCGRALRMYIEEQERDTSEYETTQFGSEIHKCIDEINKNKDVSDDFINDLLARNVTSDHIEIRRLLLKYIEKFPYKETVFSEFKFGLDENLKPCDFDNAAFRGVIDSVISESPEKMLIVDNKTSFRTYSPETEQLNFYCWAMSRHFPEIQEFYRSIYFVRLGHWERSEFPVREREIANIENAILAAAERAWSKTSDDPEPGAVCAFCPFVMSCPAKDVDIYTIRSNEEARDIAQQIILLKRKVAEMEKKLRIFVDFNGPIDLNESEVYGHKPSKTLVVPVDRVLENLSEFPGLKKIISINTTAARKLPKVFLQENLGAHEEVTTRFCHYKKGVDTDDDAP